MPSEVDFDQCWGGLGAGRRERSRLRAVPSEGTEIDLERAGSSEVDLEQCQSEGAEMDLERAGSIGVDFEKEGGTKSAYSMMIFFRIYETCRRQAYPTAAVPQTRACDNNLQKNTKNKAFARIYGLPALD